MARSAEHLAAPSWEESVRQRTQAVATELHSNVLLRAGVADLARRQTQHLAAYSEADLTDLLFLDRLARRLRRLQLPPPPDSAAMSSRVRCVHMNATRFALDAALAVRAVSSPAIIELVSQSDDALLNATLGKAGAGPRGRVDLAALRRFGIARDDRLWPVVHPPSPVLGDPRNEVAQLGFLSDECELDYIVLRKTGNPRLPLVPAMPVDHRGARLWTGLPAVVLDARLARGNRWDCALDSARIRVTGGERSAVLFDPVLLATWWQGLNN